MIFDGYGDGNNRSFNLAIEDHNGDKPSIFTEDSSYWVTGSAAVTKNTWNHLVYHFSTTKKKIWLNGTNILDSTGTYVLGSANAHNRIGGRQGNTQSYTGYLDQMVWWNGALSDAQVTALYNGGDGRVYVGDVPTSGKITRIHGTSLAWS